MTAHTKAPWKVGHFKELPYRFQGYSVLGADGIEVAFCRTWMERPSIEEMAANAKVIEDAPHLLKALRLLAEFIPDIALHDTGRMMRRDEARKLTEAVLSRLSGIE